MNRLTHKLSSKITWWTSQIGFERVRRRAGIVKRKLYWPFDDDPLCPWTPILCVWSPSVLPASSDWPPRTHVTGYYFFSPSNSYQPPAELHSFLQEGKPPLCITFGSMVNRDSERIDHTVREALKQTGNRGIILSGWSGVGNRSSKDLLYLEAVPHHWLLPHPFIRELQLLLLHQLLMRQARSKAFVLRLQQIQGTPLPLLRPTVISLAASVLGH